MADERSSIFNKAATDRLRSPDDLDRYIQVTSPSSWAVLLAILALLIGLLAWGVFGTVSTSVGATATCVDGQTMCLLDAEHAAEVNEGDLAYMNGVRGSVASVGTVPISRSEARQILQSDYLVDTLMPGNWGYLVTFEGFSPDGEGVPLGMSITTERVAPISMVLG